MRYKSGDRPRSRVCSHDQWGYGSGQSDFLTGLLAAARRWPRAAFIGPLVYFRSHGVIQKTWLRFPNVSSEHFHLAPLAVDQTSGNQGNRAGKDRGVLEWGMCALSGQRIEGIWAHGRGIRRVRGRCRLELEGPPKGVDEPIHACGKRYPP